jgi:steroid 5-alpha reductase family enzyme
MWTSDIVLVLHINWGILVGFCTLLWVFCNSLRDVSIVDRFWGPLCAVPSVLTLAQTGVYSACALLLVGLSCIWAFRLSYRITSRSWNAGQDFRYEEKTSPKITQSSTTFGSLVYVFLGQATMAWVISSPVQLGQFYSAGQHLSFLAWIGIVVWGVGFLFEAIGDWQLRKFKSKPENRGRIMEQGLWA